MALETDEVFGEVVRERKKKKTRGTDMFVTLNLNEVFGHMSTEQKQKFKKFAVELFGSERKILSYFRDRESPDNPLANVHDVKIEWQPEIGKETGKLHLHAFVGIEHSGFLSFRANDLRDDARKLFGHNIYLSAPIGSNERLKWLNYINKG